MARFAPAVTGTLAVEGTHLSVGTQGTWTWISADTLLSDESPVHKALIQAGMRLSVNKTRWLGVSVYCAADQTYTCDQVKTWFTGKSARKAAAPAKPVTQASAPAKKTPARKADTPAAAPAKPVTQAKAPAGTDTVTLTRDELANLIARQVALQMAEVEQRMGGYLVKALEQYDIRARKSARK